MLNYSFLFNTRSHLTTALVVAAIFGLLYFGSPDQPEADTVQIPISLKIEVPTPSEAISIESEPYPEVPTPWKEVTVAPGDNLSAIFADTGLSPTELHQIMQLGQNVQVLEKIIPGRKLLFDIDSGGALNGLKYELSQVKSLLITKNDNLYSARNLTYNPSVFETFRSATITGNRPSLYESGKYSGLSDAILMELSYVFQWDISFALDLRQGDSYSLLYEENFLDGVKVRDGKILSAQFNNMGKSYSAVVYQSEDGDRNYFTPDGKSMRKAFIRDPVHFSRVSSSFNLKRLHPIHKRVMPHKGIDYVANRGTPIIASGDGKVSIARQNSSSGKYIVIQHGEQYTTKYLHLSKFARGIRVGKRIKQGQVIGYVGATGWATAPHLHYEFLLNGVHRNPRTVKLPKAKPISATERERFLIQTADYVERLYSMNRPQELAQTGE
jgi:murein DD-endopeptidase MepM/ murein hydrolase activator NlpD